MNIPLPEMEKDLRDSQVDLDALSKIVDGLGEFIFNPCGEKRDQFKSDLVRWRGTLDYARSLHKKIEAKIATAKGE